MRGPWQRFPARGYRLPQPLRSLSLRGPSRERDQGQAEEGRGPQGQRLRAQPEGRDHDIRTAIYQQEEVSEGGAGPRLLAGFGEVPEAG